ncbi:uncharacterized protein LOC109141042 isoform X1 [Larimichthys crocea]|uniref:uncharacterized protein LOC109141042 isoform X1 n=1 Tax=Larimichthys crocea TaxID=215358 RepID=UPI000F5F96BE|nr:uncharacterized protein LOC109141042 isoform X1 [Larimichthys crocea]
MHQHTHKHAYSPILHPSSTILPAPTQDCKFNMHLPRGTTRPSFAPVTAFHRATQNSFTSTKRGKWGALHVCIAWKIYYHEQLKKMQQKPNSLHRDLTPEYPATSPPDSAQHKEADQSSCIHTNLNAPGNRSYLSDSHTSSPASCHGRTTKTEKLDWEKLEQTATNLHWKEKPAEEEETHRSHRTDTAKDLRLIYKSWDQAVTPEPDRRHSSSLHRKRQHDCDSFIKAKRAKQEIVDNQSDSSAQHINSSDLSVLYPDSSCCNVTRTPVGLVSYPGAQMHPYQTASWKPVWDAHKRVELHSALKDSSVNSCKEMKIPLVAQTQKEAFHGFFAPPLYFPLPSLRQQETVYLRGREFLYPHHENLHRHQLPRPGFLATSYLGP